MIVLLYNQTKTLNISRPQEILYKRIGIGLSVQGEAKGYIPIYYITVIYILPISKTCCWQ